MKGKRRDRPDDSLFEAGEYGKGSNGTWYCCPPNTDLIGNLSKHDVIEHEDGTISVSPSRPKGRESDMSRHSFKKSLNRLMFKAKI